jgi:hypothetical protein
VTCVLGSAQATRSSRKVLGSMHAHVHRHAILSAALLAGALACRREPIMSDHQTPPPAAPPAANPAVHAGLELAIAGSGTVVHVVLRNVGAAPLRLFGPVMGPDRRHHDYLRAELVAGGERRTLRFTGARNASSTGVVELASGAEIVDDLDLAIWATQPINGGRALAAGEHSVTMSYELGQPGMWSGKVTAGPVVVRAP